VCTYTLNNGKKVVFHLQRKWQLGGIFIIHDVSKPTHVVDVSRDM